MKSLNKYICLILLTIIFSTTTHAIVPQAERDALVALYDSTDGTNWTNNSNWLVGDPCDDGWFGVICGSNTITIVRLFNNNLVGTIPPELENLSNLITLSLNVNSLEGNIPSELGTMTSLQNLSLNANNLIGDIPNSLTNLTNLNSNGLNINYNGLYTDNPTLDAFLDSKQFSFSSVKDWSITQTIPPKNITINANRGVFAGASITWDLIEYTQHTGRYRVLYSEASNGPFIDGGITGDKLDNAHTLTDLIQDTSYHIIIKTETDPHTSNSRPETNNLNFIISAPSSQFMTTAVILPTVSVQEREALVALYNSTDGASWTNNTNWLIGDPCISQWHGVTCITNQITELDLFNNNLVGTLPEEIGGLLHLQILKIIFSELNGAIPASIGDLSNLIELQLVGSQLNSIPPEVGNLSNLDYLSLRSNQFTFIPPEIGSLSSLQTLRLFNNPLNSLPPEIGNLSNLINLWVSGTNIATLPPEIGNLSNLHNLFIYENKLTTLPAEIGSLANLRSLRVYSNELTELPPEIGNLINLNQIWAYSNTLTSFPFNEISNLSALTSLSIYDNQITGSISPLLGNLTNLSALVMANNKLSGAIPVELGNLNKLQNLMLEMNHLSGSIPPELGNLPSLHTLRLFSNQLSGEVPVEIMSRTRNVSLFYNALHSNDSILNTFLDISCNCDWQFTQTTAPGNLQIIAASNNSISLNWDQVSYQRHGGYKVLMSNDALGPFTEVKETISKTITAHTQGGLNTGQNYYFKLKTYTNPFTLTFSFQENKVVSDESNAVNDTTFASMGSVDLWSSISSDNLQQATIGSFIEYKITIGNNGPDDANNTGFRHNLPTGLSNGLWSCINLTGTANCPSANGSGNIDLLLNLPANSSLEFTFIAQVGSINSSSLLITSTITPPDGISDTDLLTNIQFLNFEQIFENGFE